MLKKYEGHDDRQQEFDFDAAEETHLNRELQKGIPEGATLGSPWHLQRNFRPDLKQKGEWKARNRMRHGLPPSETANEASPLTVESAQEKNHAKMRSALASPGTLKERAAALIARMKGIEGRVHEGKEPLESLYGEVQSIIGEIRDMGALLPQHGKLMDVPMGTPNYLHDENRSTVADELFGAFEVYREILDNLETGMAKNGREAVELQAKIAHEFMQTLIDANRRNMKGK